MIANIVAQNPHIPRNQLTTPPISVIIIAIHKPHLPGILPDGIGRFGSLIRSTSLSYQSFTAWLIPQMIGPERMSPKTVIKRVFKDRLEVDTAPQRKAHIGGNHVTGLMSVRTANKEGKCFLETLDVLVTNPTFLCLF